MDLSHLSVMPIILMIAGLVLALAVPFVKQPSEKLAASGERCEGIIFQIERKMTGGMTIGDDFDNNSNQYEITVRFVTNKKKEWITAVWQPEFMVTSFSGPPYKTGQKVPILYNPENPTEFVVEQKNSAKNSKVLMAVVGIGLFAVGLYQVLSHS